MKKGHRTQPQRWWCEGGGERVRKSSGESSIIKRQTSSEKVSVKEGTPSQGNTFYKAS